MYFQFGLIVKNLKNIIYDNIVYMFFKTFFISNFQTTNLLNILELIQILYTIWKYIFASFQNKYRIRWSKETASIVTMFPTCLSTFPYRKVERHIV